MKRKLNIKEMAKKAGVSVATVSRAINPSTRHKVAEDTLKKIDGLVQKFSYTPNLAAKNLRSSFTKTIGVVFPYVHNIFYSSYYSHILAAIANFLLKTDYQFKVLLLKDEKEKWNRYDFKAGEGVDGLIITQWFRFFSKEFMSKMMNVPCVIINDYDSAIKAKFVCGDHLRGGQAAAEYLYSSGHRRMAVITGSSWSVDSNERLQGFQDYLAKMGIMLGQDLIVQGDYDDDQKTYEALDKILKITPKVTAIFCCNDNMAFMVLNRLKELGISCPEDISIMGYDDDFRASAFKPPLTTIGVPIYDIATQATQSLIEYLKNNTSKKPFSGEVRIPTYLAERHTVRTILSF